MKKLTYTQKKRLRSWVIFNAYGDKKLAKEYSKRSDKVIFETLGIDLTKRKSFTEKILTEKQIKNRQKKYQKFNELVLGEYTPSEAYRYSRNQYSLKTVKELVKTKEKIKKLQGIELKKQLVIQERSKRLLKDRRKEWSVYSKHPKGHPELGFPPFLKDVADYLNLNVYKGDIGKINNNYGYAVLNYVYVKGYSFETAQNLFNVEDSFKAGKGYIYLPATKI